VAEKSGAEKAGKRRKTTGLSDLLFGDVDPFGAVLGEPVSKPVERFSLAAIRPDAEQPRRLLPADLAEAIHERKMEPAAAMDSWIRRAAADPESTLAQELRELQRLASAIQQHGLINPITLRPSETKDGRFLIVTGERRYWAHVWLALKGRPIREGEVVESADQIKATLVSPGVSIRAHQIVENLMREEINVVEKAHGLWALRRELSNDAYRRHLESEEAADDDAYRRHSETGKEGKARLVSWKLVEDALDMSRQYRARIVAVLDLSDEAQGLVDRYHLAEATIRPIVEKLKPFPDLQLQALQQLIVWQEAEARGEGEGRRIVMSVRELVEKLLRSKETGEQRSGGAAVAERGLDFGKFRQRVRGTLSYMRRVDEAAMADFARILENESEREIVDELQALRDEIDEMLATLAGK